MTQLVPPTYPGSLPVVIGHPRSRLRRFGRTLLWLGVTLVVIVTAVLLGPHVLHAIHPGPTGGGG